MVIADNTELAILINLIIIAYGRNKEEAISFDEHINHQVKSLQDEIITRFINYEAKKIKESKKWLI